MKIQKMSITTRKTTKEALMTWVLLRRCPGMRNTSTTTTTMVPIRKMGGEVGFILSFLCLLECFQLLETHLYLEFFQKVNM